MNLYRVHVVARNPRNEDLVTVPLEAIVDAGSELTWFPADALRAAGEAATCVEPSARLPVPGNGPLAC